MHIKDYATAQGWFRKHAAAPSSKGAWKAFVARNNRVQEPRTMAQEPRNMYAGGQLVQPGIGRPGYGGPGSGKKKGSIPVQSSAQKKATYYKKLLNDLPEGYLEDYKEIFLNDRGDGIFSRKPGDAPKGLLDMEKKYGNILKGKTKNITRRVGEMNSAILQSLQEEGKIVSGLSDAKDIRKADLKIVGDIDLKAPKGKVTHHFMPLAGIEGESMNLSSTKNTAFIDKKLNQKMSPYDKRLKANQKEQIKLLNEKPTGYKIRIKQLNYKAKNIYKEAGKKVPDSKGFLGYSQINVKPDGTHGIKVTGIDPSKSAAGLKGEEILYKNISKADKIKVKKIFESKLKSHLKANPKLALEIQKQLDAGYDMTKILNSPAVKKGMPTWVKGELAFVAADIINNWTKGQSFWKGLGKGIETGTFGIVDFNTDERALLSKGKKLVDQGVITQQEFDSMESWFKYTAALKKRRSNQNNLFSKAQDLKENNEQSDRKNILAGEAAGWNTLEANVPDLEAAVESAYKKEAQSTEELEQIVDTYDSITDKGSMGYDTMSKVMDHLVGEEWSKTAGTVIDRGKRLNQGEGIPWGMAGHVIKDVGNLAASPWLGLQESNILKQAKMNFKETTPQERIMEHPVYGFEEAKLKHPEAWEDITDDMDYAINPTEQLYKGGGIASLKKKW